MDDRTNNNLASDDSEADPVTLLQEGDRPPVAADFTVAVLSMPGPKTIITDDNKKMTESLFANVIHRGMHHMVDGNSESKQSWMRFSNEMFTEDRYGSIGPLATYKRWTGNEAHGKLRRLIVGAAKHFAAAYDDKFEREGDAAIFTPREENGKLITVCREKAELNAQSVRDLKEQAANNMKKQKEAAEEYIGLTSPGQGVNPPRFVDDWGGRDAEAIAALGQQTGSRTSELVLSHVLFTSYENLICTYLYIQAVKILIPVRPAAQLFSVKTQWMIPNLLFL
jgi:hypothetical protein